MRRLPALLLVLAVVGGWGAAAYRGVLLRMATPGWDEAEYLSLAWHLTGLLQNALLTEFLRRSYDMAFKPFFFEWLLSGVFSVGPTQPVEGLVLLGRTANFGLFLCLAAGVSALTHLLVAQACPRLRGESVALVSLFATGVLLASPVMVMLSVQALMEVTGAVLSLVALSGYLLAAREPRASRHALWLQVTAGATLSAFLTKYNYGIPLILALSVAILWLGLGVRSGLQDRLRTALLCLLPLGIGIPAWFASPGKAQAALAFAQNRSGQAPLLSLRNLDWYPAALLTDYHLSPVLGAVVLILALCALTRPRGAVEVQVLAAFVLATVAMATAHPYKLARVISPAFAPLCVLAGVGLAGVVESWSLPGPGRSRSRLVAAGCAVLC